MRTLMNRLQINNYNIAHKMALEHYQLEIGQDLFTAFPMEVLEESLRNPRKKPLVITADNDVMGFLVLDSSEDVQIYTSNPKGLLLRAFSIDSRFQGKGYGLASMHLLKHFIKENFSEYEELVFGVNHLNEPARRLYLKAGFEETVKTVIGRRGPQYVFRWHIVK